jgi:hypothetical protein
LKKKQQQRLLSADYRRFTQISETTESIRAAEEEEVPPFLLQPLICENLRQSADNLFLLLHSVSSSTLNRRICG